MTRLPRGFSRRTLLKASGLAAIGNVTGTVRETTTEESDDWESLSLDEQLDIVREATQPYSDVSALRDANYKSIALPLLCGRGYLFDKATLYDSEVDPRNPESLFYLVTDDGELTLGGPEYVVLTETDDEGNPADSAPNLFNDEAEAGTETTTADSQATTSEEEGWIFVDDPVAGPIWALRVWVHEENPAGIFSQNNPRFEDMPGCVPADEFFGDS